MIVAHRGFAHDNQENTLDAFHDAEVNADFIELDVRNTSDNIPVVHHDECVTEDNYCINDMTYTELHDKGRSRRSPLV